MNDQLRDKLIKQMDEEQSLRSQWIDKKDDSQLGMQIADVDAQNTAWLESLIDQDGLPGISDVEDDGVQALFLLIQHSPSLDFQKKCLALMQAAVEKGEFPPGHLAYLTDRVRIQEQKAQIYGTQGQLAENGRIVPYPIEDEEHVDERRKAVGLEPTAEYFTQMNEFYKTKPKE